MANTLKATYTYVINIYIYHAKKASFSITIYKFERKNYKFVLLLGGQDVKRMKF